MRGARIVAVCLALAALPGVAAASEALWTVLKDGGQVVLIRHAITTPGVGDPDGMQLDDCRTQRNLTDEGRQHARQVGAAFRARGIPVERVLTSPWCRCIETAQLAFGKAGRSDALGNLFGRYENRERQVAQLRKIASEAPKANLVLVTHGSTIAALTGISPGTGEMVVLSRGKVAGRLAVQ
jgi:broad specificity phosphatase PhoE